MLHSEEVLHPAAAMQSVCDACSNQILLDRYSNCDWHGNCMVHGADDGVGVYKSCMRCLVPG